MGVGAWAWGRGVEMHLTFALLNPPAPGYLCHKIIILSVFHFFVFFTNASNTGVLPNRRLINSTFL